MLDRNEYPKSQGSVGIRRFESVAFDRVWPPPIKNSAYGPECRPIEIHKLTTWQLWNLFSIHLFVFSFFEDSQR